MIAILTLRRGPTLRFDFHRRLALGSTRLAVLQRYRRGGASRGLSPVNLPQGRLLIGWTMGVTLAESL